MNNPAGIERPTKSVTPRISECHRGNGHRVPDEPPRPEFGGQPVAACFQCQRCTSWCPVTPLMDLKPHQMIRFLQLGAVDHVYESRSMWLCVGCMGCGAVCPNGIDFNRVAKALQRHAGARARRLGADVLAFDEAFLASVRASGRACEAATALRYKLMRRKLFRDARLGLWMFWRGKLRLVAEKIRDRAAIRKLFDDEEGTRGRSRP